MISAEDKVRLELLNTDHHRRMSLNSQARLAGDAKVVTDLNAESRLHILNAMQGCLTRHKMAIKDSRRLRILELGCGYSGDKPVVQWHFENDWGPAEFYGIEIVPHVAEEARKRFPDANIATGALEDAPPEWNGFFDFIYGRHVMEHVVSAQVALTRIKDMLQPHGIFGMVTPHYFPDPEPAHICQKRINEWVDAMPPAGLKSAFAVLKQYTCEECHLVAVRSEWPFQP